MLKASVALVLKVASGKVTHNKTSKLLLLDWCQTHNY